MKPEADWMMMSEAGFWCAGPALAVARERRVDDLRINLLDFVVAQAGAGHGARTEVLDQDVRLFDDALQQLEVVGVFQVGLDALLVRH
jgi:uncharacterized protein YheU (UPF0270 family)